MAYVICFLSDMLTLIINPVGNGEDLEMVKKVLIPVVILLSGCTIYRPCPAVIIPDYAYERQLRLYDAGQQTSPPVVYADSLTEWERTQLFKRIYEHAIRSDTP
jgi:hypothetical protein